MDLSEYLDQLEGDIRSCVVDLQKERCEITHLLPAQICREVVLLDETENWLDVIDRQDCMMPLVRPLMHIFMNELVV